MAVLQWDKTDFLVCLGVLPQVADYETSFCYLVERGGLVLFITVTPYESIIELQLQRTGSAANLLSLTLLVSGVVEYKSEKWGKYLQLSGCQMVANRFYDRYEQGGELDRDIFSVEIGVDPDIRIECDL